MARRDGRRSAFDGPRRVLEQYSLLRRRHQAEQVAGLRVVVIVLAVIPALCGAFDRQGGLGKIRLRDPLTAAVRLVGGGAATVAVYPHLAVPMIAVERTFRRIHRNLREIDAEPIALRIAVGK